MASSRTVRHVVVDVMKSIGIAIILILVVFGAANVLLTTPVGHQLADRLRPPSQGRYAFVYGKLGSVAGPVGFVVLLVSYGWFARRRKTGGGPAPTILAVAGLVLAAASWGYWYADGKSARADDDRQFAAAVAIAERAKAELAKLYQAYDDAVSADDVPRALEPKSLAAKAEVAQARTRVEELARSAHGLETGVADVLQRTRAELEALPIAEAHKRDALAGFDGDAAKVRSQVKAFCDGELEVLAAAGQIFTFVESRSGAFALKGDALLFRSSADGRAFDRLRERFQAAVSREAKIAQALKPVTAAQP